MLDLILLDLELGFGDRLLPTVVLLTLLVLALLPLGLAGLRLWARAQATELLLKTLGASPWLLLLLGGFALLLLLVGVGLGLGLGLA